MARTVDKVNLTFFMLASDYNPVHYGWTENELAALGDCKATAEVIKKRLEDNGAKVKEMYAIEHKSEKKADSKSKEFHGATDETKMHYHILVKFERSHGAMLEKIAEYIGVPPEIIEKSRPGRYSYPNNLAYLIHIKYENKIQYAPEAVVTLAGTDYMDYFNENKERWIKARAIVAKRGGKPLNRRFREAIAKMEKGEISYEELCDIEEYDKLRLETKYRKKLQDKKACVLEKAREDYGRLLEKIRNNEITLLEEITANEKWKLAYKYYKESIIAELAEQKKRILIRKIEREEITSLSEIRANEGWALAYKYHKEDIEDKLVHRNHLVLLNMIKKKEITSLTEIRANEDWKLVYEYSREERKEIEKELVYQNRNALVDMIKGKEITSLREIQENEDWNLIYKEFDYEIDGWLGVHK